MAARRDNPRRRVLHGAAWLVPAAALATAWGLGVPRLRAIAPRYHAAGPVEVRFSETPPWIDGAIEANLVSVARRHIRGALRRDGLVGAREALLASGWFDEVPQVRRQAGGLVEIEARFSRPFAVVRDGEGDHLVDVRGRLLPRSFTAGTAGLTAIVGARGRRPRDTPVWPGGDVQAALAVLQLVRSRPWRHQVAEIDIGAPSIVLITDRGCSILWGRPPGAEKGSEVPPDQKLRYLDYHFKHYGHIDRGFLRLIDITGDVVIGH